MNLLKTGCVKQGWLYVILERVRVNDLHFARLCFD